MNIFLVVSNKKWGGSRASRLKQWFSTGVEFLPREEFCTFKRGIFTFQILLVKSSTLFDFVALHRTFVI